MEYFGKKLPHFDHVGKIFFITFRLENSIAVPVAIAIKKERALAIKNIEKTLSKELQQAEYYKIERQYFQKYEGLLDHPTYGDRYLSEPNCLKIVKESLHHFDGTLYRLEAYCIMSNHVHLLIDTSIQLSEGDKSFDTDLQEYKFVKDIMFRIKGRSARYLNLERKTTGTGVWAHENFDRYIRNEKHFFYALDYTLQNPVKAKLVEEWEEWEGTYFRGWGT
jgi:putative transposase